MNQQWTDWKTRRSTLDAKYIIHKTLLDKMVHSGYWDPAFCGGAVKILIDRDHESALPLVEADLKEVGWQVIVNVPNPKPAHQSYEVEFILTTGGCKYIGIENGKHVWLSDPLPMSFYNFLNKLPTAP